MARISSILSTWHMRVLGRKRAYGSGTVSGFYDESTGYTEAVTIDHTEEGTGVDAAFDFTPGTYSPPEFLKDDDTYLPGCIIHYDCANSDGGQFTVLFERIDDGVYATLSGDLDFNWSRTGRLW